MAQSGTPGPVYIEYPSHVIQEELDVRTPLPPEAYRLVQQRGRHRRWPRRSSYISAAEQPILLVGHGVHTTRAGESVGALAEAMACPVIQTSGGTSFIEGLEDRTFPYGFSPAAIDAVVKSDLVPRDRHRTRRAGALRPRQALGRQRGQPQVDPTSSTTPRPSA